MSASQQYDIVIVGAGPAGCGTALALAESGLNIALLDKAQFPRDKVCGDGLSPDVLAQLDKFPVPLRPQFDALASTVPITNIRLFAPDGTKLQMPLALKGKPLEGAYISRLDFDNFLVEEVRKLPNVRLLENVAVKHISVNDTGVAITTNTGTLNAQLVVGADGAQSIVARQLASYEVDHKHQGAGLRQYYENVTGMGPHGCLELHFPASIQPGYFWIFPLPNNRFNVGVWMVSDSLKRKGTNLRKEFERLIAEDPNIAPKFSEAQNLEPVRGFGLPLGTKKRPLSGNRFLLVGDAAALIDPFTGEGIGNGLRSGRIAAKQIESAFKTSDFSAPAMKQYDAEIWKAMGHEMKVGRWVQRLQDKPITMSWIIRKLANNPSGKKWLAHMIEGEPMGANWINPLFYLRGFFR